MNSEFHELQAELYSALSNPTRIRILELLRGSEVKVGTLQQKLGSEGSTISQQLAILRARRLVKHRRVGTNVYYSTDQGVEELMDACQSLVQRQVELVRKSVPTSENEVARADNR